MTEQVYRAVVVFAPYRKYDNENTEYEKYACKDVQYYIKHFYRPVRHSFFVHVVRCHLSDPRVRVYGNVKFGGS